MSRQRTQLELTKGYVPEPVDVPPLSLLLDKWFVTRIGLSGTS